MRMAVEWVENSRFSMLLLVGVTETNASICLSLSIYLSVCLSTYLSIYLSTLCTPSNPRQVAS